MVHQNQVLMLRKLEHGRLQIVMGMEGALEEGIYAFKLAELHTTYESRLKKLNITSSNNRT